MPMFRKKPVVIEAVEFRGFGGDGVPLNPWPVGWDVSAWRSWPWEGPPLSLVIPTLEGDHHAIAGDWIIRGVKGEFYPCKPDIFAATYEPAAPAREEPAPARPWGPGMEHDRLNDTSAGMNSMSGCINVDTPLGPRCANPDHWRPAPEEPAPATMTRSEKLTSEDRKDGNR